MDDDRPLMMDPPQERGDAARNRKLLLDAARALIAEHEPGEVTTDDIAAAAGVGHRDAAQRVAEIVLSVARAERGSLR